ncbi:MAG: hypothetical protein ACRELD_15605 [Longimicrobiales bacterium]
MAPLFFVPRRLAALRAPVRFAPVFLDRAFFVAPRFAAPRLFVALLLRARFLPAVRLAPRFLVDFFDDLRDVRLLRGCAIKASWLWCARSIEERE